MWFHLLFHRRRVNGRRNRMEKDALTNETEGALQALLFCFFRLPIRQCLTGNDADRTKLQYIIFYQI